MSNNRTLIIVLIIAAVVLLCCCPLLVGATYWLWVNGDSLVGTTSRLVPSLMLL
jgi:hypothetical protein